VDWRLTRRAALSGLGSFLAGSPVWAQQASPDPRDRFPGLDEIADTLEFEPVARAKMTRSAYDYVAGGVDGEFTLRRNRQAFEWATLTPRALAPASAPDLATEVFGQKLSCPIVVAPTGTHSQAHPEGEKATHQGATAAGVLMSVSSNSSYPIQEIAAAAKGPLWFQLYARDTAEGTRERVERALEAGCRAVCLTVDSQYHSHRERLLHDRHLSAAIAGLPARSRSRRGTEPPPAPYRLTPQNPDLTWKTVDEIRAYTSVPFLLKGVLSAEDARLAAERGVSGIIVSNHGGRYLDYAPATFEVLPEIVEAVAGRIPVLVDGGFRRGADIFKALAVGAKAVQLGRPPLWGLGAFGSAGVRRVLEILQAELATAMAQTGCATVASITRSAVRLDLP
jgi:4-hydroxymandelate oxidase